MSRSEANTNKTLLESIKVLDNKIYNFEAHQDRMRSSYAAMFEKEIDFDFQELESRVASISKDLHKLRIIYSPDKKEVEFHPYRRKEIHSLKLVFDDEIDYEHKSADRAALHKLYDKKGNHDDILIVRNGLLTDSYYCNVALLQDGTWYTPKDPLLKGTMRQKLLDEKELVERNISLDSLFHYCQIRLFNAMIEFGELELGIEQLH